MENTVSDGDVNTIRVSAAEFQKATRTAISSTDYSVSWKEGEIIGIFPMTEGSRQIAFDIQQGAGSSTASFEGKGWGLKSNMQYVAYCPYNTYGLTDKANIPLIYSDQKQKGNGNTDHLGDYDYLVSTPTYAVDGALDFQFEHIGALLHLQLNVPDDGTFTFMQLNTDEGLVTKASLDLNTNTTTIQETTGSLRMGLEGVEVASGENLDVYMMLYPTDMSGKEIKVYVFDNDKNFYSATLQGQDFTAGSVWEYPGSLQKETEGVIDGHGFIDLGLESGTLWATANVGADSEFKYGGYYAWGDSEPYYTVDSSGKKTWKPGYKEYNWASYKWGVSVKVSTDITDIYLTKYCNDLKKGYEGFTDTLHTLLPEDDPATVLWGEAWRSPTPAEIEELAKCKWEFVDFGTNTAGKSSRYFYKVTGPSQKYIYLIASMRLNSSLTDISSMNSYRMYYWSNEFKESSPTYAMVISCIKGDTSGKLSYERRDYGLQIRPVLNRKQIQP